MFYLENILERATRLKERYFPSDLFYTAVSRPFFNLPPRATASKRNFLVVDRGRKVFSRDRLESVSSASFLPPRLTLTPMEITSSTLFFTRIPSRYSYSVAEFPDESNNNLGTTLRPTEKELNSQNQSLLNWIDIFQFQPFSLSRTSRRVKNVHSARKISSAATFTEYFSDNFYYRGISLEINDKNKIPMLRFQRMYNNTRIARTIRGILCRISYSRP